jgi:hypothetical protein
MKEESSILAENADTKTRRYVEKIRRTFGKLPITPDFNGKYGGQLPPTLKKGWIDPESLLPHLLP